MDTRSVHDESAVNDARHEVLTDSNAQTARNYLKRLFQEEARFRSRWIWELLQNARDASSAQGVRVWLTRIRRLFSVSSTTRMRLLMPLAFGERLAATEKEPV
jgi:hypothetical protein